MEFCFDHLVWFSKRPEEAISLLRQIGIHTARGGRHEFWGTYNSLSYFGLSYIEFLGIENFSIAVNQEDNRLVTQIVELLGKGNQEGPARVAIRTNSIERLAVKLKEEGYIVYGPLSGERVRADGQVIRWSLLFPEGKDSDLTLPFFIQWEKSDEVRLFEFEKQGLIGSHPLGNLKLESVGFVVQNLEETLSTWGKLLDLQQSEEFIDSSINACCRELELSGTKLRFCTPIREGLAADVLKRRGPAPFLANLEGANQSRFFEVMNGYFHF